MPHFRYASLILILAIAPAVASRAATELDIAIEQTCPVLDGTDWTVDVAVKARLTGDASLGLAGIVFDLNVTEDGDAIAVAIDSPPTHMAPFNAITGLNGFGGTPIDDTLRQVGGAQNTIGHSTLGSVTTMIGVADYTVIATFSLVLDAPPSVPYVVTLSNIRATVIDSDQSAAPYKTTAVAPLCNSISHEVWWCGACVFTATSGPGSCYVSNNEAICESSPFVCDVGLNCACTPGGVTPCGTTCFADCDGNGTVNASDRGQVSANIGQTAYRLLCQFDLDGNGAINAADRGQVSANISTCNALPDYQNGSGLNGGVPDSRFSLGSYMGHGTDCSTGTTCP